MTRCRWPLALAAAGAALCLYGVLASKVGRAAEVERCQIFVKPAGGDWQPYTTKGRPVWTFTSCSACSTDIGGQSKLQPDGTALTCVDVRKLVRK